MLSDAQIERYSRQIILPEVGGIGQERLLAARITLLAESDDLTPALNYLAGAGIGTIGLHSAVGDAAPSRAAQMRDLNPDVRIDAPARSDGGDATLVVLAATNRIIEAVRRVNQESAYRQVVFARLGEPYLVAILTARPLCMECAHKDLLAEIGKRGTFAAAVAMVAAVETIKTLLAAAPQPSRLIEFSGYESRTRELNQARPAPHCPVCG